MSGIAAHHCFASEAELERLAACDPRRALKLVGDKVQVGDREAVVERFEVATAGGVARPTLELRWLEVRSSRLR